MVGIERWNSISLLILTAILITAVMAGCLSQNKPIQKEMPSLESPDLRVTNVRVENSYSSDRTVPYKLIYTIRNDGDGSADGFRVNSGYECPSEGSYGVIGALDRAGSLNGNSESTYEQPFGVNCPSIEGYRHYGTMRFTVVVFYDNRENSWEGTLYLP